MEGRWKAGPDAQATDTIAGSAAGFGGIPSGRQNVIGPLPPADSILRPSSINPLLTRIAATSAGRTAAAPSLDAISSATHSFWGR